MNVKKPEERKSCTISFRVKPDEKEQIEFLVKLFNSNKSSWIRNHLRRITKQLNINKIIKEQ